MATDRRKPAKGGTKATARPSTRVPAFRYGIEQYSHLYLALEAADIGIWDWDLSSNRIMMSANMKRILDIGEDEAGYTFDKFLKVIHPEDRPRIAAALKKTIRRKGSFDEEFRIEKKDSTLHWMRIRGRAPVGAGGVPDRVMGSLHDKTDRKMAFDALASARDELEEQVKERTSELLDVNEHLRREIAIKNRLQKQIMEISEKEQRRIGQDLHDSLSQQLGGILFMGQVLVDKLNKAGRDEAGDMRKLVGHLQDALTYTRDLSHGLYPTLGEGGLRSALNELAAHVSELFGVTVTVDCARGLDTSDETVIIQIYRIVQEALNNAIKHGQAGRMAVRLFRRKGLVVLTVADNGVGFPKLPNQKGLGLNIMEYRASSIGASFRIDSARNKGTTVKCVFGRTRAFS